MTISPSEMVFVTPKDEKIIRSFNSQSSAGQVALTWSTVDTTIQKVTIYGTYNDIRYTLASNISYPSGEYFWNKATSGVYAIQIVATEYVYTLGQPITLEWSNSGSISNVSLYYSSNSFVSQTAIAENIVNTGSYVWTPTDGEHLNIEVQIVGNNVDESTAIRVSLM
jgi:hypothetical protein